MSTDSLKGFFLGFNVEFHTACESDVEHSKAKSMSITTTRHETKSIAPTQKNKPIDPARIKKQSKSLPPHFTQVNIDTYTKTKSFSACTQKQSQFRPLDPRTNTKAISTPPTKTKFNSTPTLEPSQLPYLI